MQPEATHPPTPRRRPDASWLDAPASSARRGEAGAHPIGGRAEREIRSPSIVRDDAAATRHVGHIRIAPQSLRWSLAVWHRLLTPAWVRPTAAAQLRGWARVLQWRRASRDERLRLLQRAVWTPVRAWREAAADVARFGAEVQETAGVPPAVQRRQLWWLAVRHGLTAESYVDHALYRRVNRRRAAAYLEQREHARVVWWLLRQRQASPHEFPGRDKTRFPDWCRSNGLPTVPVLLELEGGAVVRSSIGEPAGEGASRSAAAYGRLLPRRDLFAKPSDGQYGAMSLPWHHDPASDRWVGRDGCARTADVLLTELAAASTALRPRGGVPNRMLLQPKLRNHVDLRPLAPRALCTVRILTCRAPGEAGRIVFAAFRMAVGDAPADNFHFGGIIAPVDLATGALGEALRRRAFVLAPLERHPDTGARIAGHRLPHWEAAKALALRAFAAAPERATVGWDVAITDDGPLLVEGNTASHPDIAQATMRGPLEDSGYPAALEAHVRRAMRA